jgi:hypothetical protein
MNQDRQRRSFVLHLLAGGSAAAAGLPVRAADAVSTVRLTESDAYAKSMGFRLDTNQVDQAKYPRHDAATQQCSKCQLFSGKEGDAVGPCSFYGGRLVPPTGWCRNFKVRKAAA